MFDDYSTEINYEDEQDMFSSPNIISDIFNDVDIPWSLHYLPCSENLIPFEEIFPSYRKDLFDHSNGRADNSDQEIIIRNEKMKVMNEESSMEMETETQQQLPRKRSVLSSKKKKKDRHSKIDTARGMRDRRMRLSREVARQFFDLQDMLGVDKASKAIEWLLLQSSSAIKALSNSASTSTATGITRGSSHLSEKRKKRRSLQKDASAVRESREKARARAKQRTREKMLLQTLNLPDHPQPPNCT